MQRLTHYLIRPTRSGIALITIIAILFASIAHTSRAEAPMPGDLSKSAGDMIVDGLTVEQRAAKVDAFFAQWNLPLAGYGKDFVRSADAYGVDWRLVASIGFIESTGGKFACRKVTANAWGWHSCKSGFKDYPTAIESITRHLAGQNDSTDHYYAGKTVPQILDAYNPPTIRHNYKALVMGTMDKMSKMQVSESTQLAMN